MTRHPQLSPRRSLPATVLASLLVFFLGGCCSDKEHRGQSVPIRDEPMQQTPSGGGDPANPIVYANARFDSHLVHFDVMLIESMSPDTARIELRWMSHSGGHGSPLPWLVGPPQDSYTNNPPTQRWYVYSIPATCDRSKDCFHVQVGLYKADGTAIGKVHKSFEPMLNTDWGSPLALEP
jgi:hypothetical protein